MPLPQPEDLADRIRALEQGLRDVRSSLTNQGGVTIASQGWLLRSMAFPTTPPAGDVYILANAGRLWARSTLGDVPLEPIPQAAPIINQASMLAGASAPASYSDTYVSNLREDVRATRQYGFDLTTILRNAGFIIP